MPTQTVKSNSDDSITYTCEHVISTLLDDVIEGYHQYSGYATPQVIQNILNMQETERWVLGACEFNNNIEYSFENENGLLAPLLSIPIPFNTAYEFTYDTTVYPWISNLKIASNTVKSEIRWGKDMTDFNKVSDPTDIVNYIIPLGVGEGINQLNISSINSGLKYIKDDASIAQWGKRPYIWIDRSIENVYTLKSTAESLLTQWKDPKISFSVNAVDLSILPEYEKERKILNGITRIIVDDEEYFARIVGEEISDLSNEYDVKYQINNKIDDIATTQADLERRMQVSDAYSQGATNIYSFTYQDNCDDAVPASIVFNIDNDVQNVNTCELTFETKKYRGYNAVSGIYDPDPGSTNTASVDTVPSSHGHTFDLPEHDHYVTARVTEYNIEVTTVSLNIDGINVSVDLSEDRFDLVPYLSKTSGKINRGKHYVYLTPDMPARIEANVILRVFIQSRLGGVY